MNMKWLQDKGHPSMPHLKNGKQRSRVTLLMLLAFCFSSVSCQDSVEGLVGEDVMLPCVYDSSILQASAHWRDGDDRVLLDIVESSENYTYQGQKYKGRVSSFPDQYRNGNFSIIMKNLREDDSGTYECFIQTVRHRKMIRLSVSDKPTVAPAKPVNGGGAAGLNLHQVALLSALCLLLCF